MNGDAGTVGRPGTGFVARPVEARFTPRRVLHHSAADGSPGPVVRGR